MRIGHGRAPLPVPEGTPMGGYAARVGGAAGVLDPLGVDCLSIAGDHGRLVLVVAEILCIDAALAEAVRERVAAAVGGDIWVCATHTHSGPEVGGLAGPAPLEWRRAVADAAAAAADAAVATERELAGRLHTGVVEGVASPRGDDAAEACVTVDVLACTDAHGDVRGVLAVLPIHPTVLPASSNVISGDLAGAIRSRLAREFEWAVVATGAAGDFSTRRTRRAQTPEECRRLGEVAAEQLVALVRDAGKPMWEASDGSVAAEQGSIALPAYRREEAELVELRARVTAAQEDARDAAEARTLATALQGIAIAERAPDAARDVPIELAAARIGRLELFAVGAEPFHSFADALRPAVCLGYANGHAGYLPDAAAYASPGYEVLASALPPDAAARTRAALIELLPDHTENRVTATDATEIDQLSCGRLMKAALDRVIATQTDSIAAAADVVVEALCGDGIVQVFGTGHSRAFAMELAGRAGGLVPVNALSIKDLVMYGGTAPAEILDPTVERDPGLAARILDLADLHPDDVFVIASNSGGNGSVVELARLARERGHRVIAVTSLEHTRQVTSRHPSGLRLFEVADLVIDNCGVFGDAALPLPGGGAIAATSSLTGALIAQMLVAEVCGRLLRLGREVPVLISANVPGGDEHNARLAERYGARVRRSEP